MVDNLDHHPQKPWALEPHTVFLLRQTTLTVALEGGIYDLIPPILPTPFGGARVFRELRGNGLVRLVAPRLGLRLPLRGEAPLAGTQGNRDQIARDLD